MAEHGQGRGDEDRRNERQTEQEVSMPIWLDLPGWRFAIDECVHLDGDLSEGYGTVIDRTRTAAGELYTIWLTYDDNGKTRSAKPAAMARVSVGGDACRRCPYWGGRCLISD